MYSQALPLHRIIKQSKLLKILISKYGYDHLPPEARDGIAMFINARAF